MQSVLRPRLSLVVPVYGNEGSIPDLVDAVGWLNDQLRDSFEAVFVVDGSPDRSYARLREVLPNAPFRSQLLTLSRNFGAFAAIRCGLAHAEGDTIAVMAADLQEPVELMVQFEAAVSQGADLAMGVREGRDDPALSKLASSLFWKAYRRFVMPDIPKGGVDVFAISRAFRDNLLKLDESNSSLLAQIFWLGGRRAFVGYRRRQRQHGRSAWTLHKKLRYLSDSVFSFTDLPVRLLMFLGTSALLLAVTLSLVVLVAKLWDVVAVPGYAGTMLAILFFGAFNALGLGVVGSYAWRTFENTKQRPLSIVQTQEAFGERP
jgi:glycosyltransferase involved in cell wall biosynthesis